MKNKAVLGIMLCAILIASVASFSPMLSINNVSAHDPGSWVEPQETYMSTLITFIGRSIRDELLATWIGDYVDTPGFHTMIFVFEQCYSGGFILDMVEYGLTHSLPVVAMSASMFNETSYGSTAWNGEDYFVQQFAIALDAYDGSDPNTAPDMWGAYATAKANDIHAPGGSRHGSQPEHPLCQSRGLLPVTIKLGNASTASAWKAILWVGKGNRRRYWNDVNRIHRVLTQKYGFDDENDIYLMFGSGTYYGSDTLNDGGKIDSSAALMDMRYALRDWLSPQMNESVQLFFWASDHGGTEKPIGGSPPGTYEFSLDSWFIEDMASDQENVPYVSLDTYNVISSDNGVYLNDFFLGNLTPTGPGGMGNDTFYFDDNVVPLYSETNNTLRLELGSQLEPYDVKNMTLGTGGIATETTAETPVGGIWTPVDKLALLVPYIALASTIISAVVVAAVLFKRKKKP